MIFAFFPYLHIYMESSVVLSEVYLMRMGLDEGVRYHQLILRTNIHLLYFEDAPAFS